jgi:hypothetical protein
VLLSSSSLCLAASEQGQGILVACVSYPHTLYCNYHSSPFVLKTATKCTREKTSAKSVVSIWHDYHCSPFFYRRSLRDGNICYTGGVNLACIVKHVTYSKGCDIESAVMTFRRHAIYYLPIIRTWVIPKCKCILYNVLVIGIYQIDPKI